MTSAMRSLRNYGAPRGRTRAVPLVFGVRNTVFEPPLGFDSPGGTLRGPKKGVFGPAELNSADGGDLSSDRRVDLYQEGIREGFDRGSSDSNEADGPQAP